MIYIFFIHWIAGNSLRFLLPVSTLQLKLQLSGLFPKPRLCQIGDKSWERFLQNIWPIVASSLIFEVGYLNNLTILYTVALLINWWFMLLFCLVSSTSYFIQVVCVGKRLFFLKSQDCTVLLQTWLKSCVSYISKPNKSIMPPNAGLNQNSIFSNWVNDWIIIDAWFSYDCDEPC